MSRLKTVWKGAFGVELCDCYQCSELWLHHETIIRWEKVSARNVLIVSPEEESKCQAAICQCTVGTYGGSGWFVYDPLGHSPEIYQTNFAYHENGWFRELFWPDPFLYSCTSMIQMNLSLIHAFWALNKQKPEELFAGCSSQYFHT